MLKINQKQVIIENEQTLFLPFLIIYIGLLDSMTYKAGFNNNCT